jgi:hypothetical protein
MLQITLHSPNLAGRYYGKDIMFVIGDCFPVFIPALTRD